MPFFLAGLLGPLYCPVNKSWLAFPKAVLSQEVQTDYTSCVQFTDVVPYDPHMSQYLEISTEKSRFSENLEDLNTLICCPMWLALRGTCSF